MYEPVWVKMLVTYPSVSNKKLKETSYHEFLDAAPEFETSNVMLQVYLEMEGVEVRLWHLDPPSTTHEVANHPGTHRIQ